MASDHIALLLKGFKMFSFILEQKQCFCKRKTAGARVLAHAEQPQPQQLLIPWDLQEVPPSSPPDKPPPPQP